MTRSDAVRKAKAEKEAYVVLAATSGAKTLPATPDSVRT